MQSCYRSRCRTTLRHPPDLEQVELQWKIILLFKKFIGTTRKNEKPQAELRVVEDMEAFLEAGCDRLAQVQQFP